MLIRTVMCATLVVGVWAAAPHAQRSRYGAIDESTITQTLTFAGSGDRTVDVRLINGDIRVVGTNDANVQLNVKKVIRAETDADLADAQRDVRLDIVDRAPRLEAIVRDDRGHVCGEPSFDSGQWPRVRYTVTFDAEVRVPSNTRLRLCTINGGDLRVEGTTGDFDVDNVNGQIDMEQVAGSGSARTVNGPVTVSFTANPSEDSDFYTVNGNVVVTFQDGLSADLKMKTFNGGLFTDFDVQPLLQPMSATGERRNGRFIYRSNDFIRVRAGSGGPEHTFETLNGNVRALRATR